MTAHKGLVFAIKNSSDYKQLYTGGADGKIIIWDSKLKILAEIMLNNDQFISQNPKIRSIDFNEKNKRILVGT